MKILCFGSCNIDYVYSVDHILQPGETLASTELKLFPGGKGLNQAIALSRAGAKTFFAGCIGTDGQMLQQVLEKAEVDLQYLEQTAEKTGHAIIQVDSAGENSIIIFPGANDCVTKKQIDRVLQNFEAEDVLLIQNEISNLPYLVEVAGKMGMRVYFNPSPLNDRARQVCLDKVHCLLVNETEAFGMTGSREPEALQQFIIENQPRLQIVLTQGKKGSVFIDQDKMISQHAYQVEAVDTTAAGDTFAGYYIAGICRGDSIKNAMDRAAAASAIVVSRNGASSSIPRGQEVDRALPMLQPTADRSNRKKMEQVEVFFRNNYVHGTLQQLAQQLGYSVSYTGSWLREQYNATFTQLLYREKCRITAELLCSTELPVSQIISRVGCTNESFLREKFRQQYGCTPLTYRRKEREK